MVYLKKHILSPDKQKAWIMATDPSEAEIKELSAKYALDPDLLSDALDPDELARLEALDNGMLAIMRLPLFNPLAEAPYYTAPFSVFLLEEAIVTVSARPFPMIEDAGLRGPAIEGSNELTFILTLLLRSGFEFLRYLKEIKRKTDAIEKDLQKAVVNEELMRLLAMSKGLVYFLTSLRSNEALLHRIKKTRAWHWNEKTEDLWDDVFTEFREAIEMANIYANILNGTMETFANVINNNLNMVMKRLTVISLLLMFPTMITSLYGMNVALPFQRSPHAFAGLVIGSAVVGAALFFIFRSKKFL